MSQCHTMTSVSLVILSYPDICGVAMSTSTIQPKLASDKNENAAFLSSEHSKLWFRKFAASSLHNIQFFPPQALKALHFCFLEITKSVALLLINLAVLRFHAGNTSCKQFYTLLHVPNLLSSRCRLNAPRLVDQTNCHTPYQLCRGGGGETYVLYYKKKFKMSWP